jgi:hypothetical protein
MLDMDMPHGQGHAPWAFSYRMDMVMGADKDIDYYWIGTLSCNYAESL